MLLLEEGLQRSGAAMETAGDVVEIEPEDVRDLLVGEAVEAHREGLAL
jgi:hypothetical protein